MKPTQPKFLPTLVCFLVVGLLAATLPHPGFDTQVSLPSTQGAQ